MATEPEEFKKMIDCCGNVTVALGSVQRTVSEKEKSMLVKMRRSIIAKRDLPAGTVLTLSDLDFKRPGDGISPAESELLVGKVLNKDIKADCIIRKEDIK